MYPPWWAPSTPREIEQLHTIAARFVRTPTSTDVYPVWAQYIRGMAEDVAALGLRPHYVVALFAEHGLGVQADRWMSEIQGLPVARVEPLASRLGRAVRAIRERATARHVERYEPAHTAIVQAVRAELMAGGFRS